MLRKLRLCLLLTLRLYGAPMGELPVTVANISSGKVFSIYEWVARDELSLSHNHDEIVSLEETCRSCRQAFDPSSPAADSQARWSMLQKVCRTAIAGGGERAARFFMTNHDLPGPLLLYLGGHNHPVKLAAHRALLLGTMWGQQVSTTLNRYFLLFTVL